MTTKVSDFSAREPSLGYLFQIKYALLMLLRNGKLLGDSKVTIEALDDVAIEVNGSQMLYQTKLHIKNPGNLTNGSADFWKTIRIWSDHILNSRLDVATTFFYLVTTEVVPKDSVLHSFKNDIKDDEAKLIVDKLDVILNTYESEVIKNAQGTYGKLHYNDKIALVKNIKIIDSSISINDIDNEIKKELIYSTYPSTLDAFLEMLDGWWLKKAIENLIGKIDSIELQHLQFKISSIRDSFESDSLPNHFPDQLEVTDEEVDSMKDSVFLKQLSIINIDTNSKALRRAISDYRRAYEQRSKWLRYNLLKPDEEDDYDRKLSDYWRNIHDIMCDHANGKDEEEQARLGNHFYINQFVQSCPQVKIREKFNEDFLTRGSYHMLSNRKAIGWHPNFRTLL